MEVTVVVMADMGEAEEDTVVGMESILKELGVKGKAGDLEVVLADIVIS